MIYKINGDSLSGAYDLDSAIGTAYDIDGIVAWSNRPTHAVSDSYTVSMLYDIPAIGSGTQGIACDSLSQTIAQLYSGKIITIDLSDGSYTQRASSFNLGHGSTGQFAPQKANSSDLYPPLYVSTQSEQSINDTIYAIFAEVAIGESSSAMNRIFYVPFDGETTGDGYTLFAFDFANDIVYSVYFSGYYTTTGTGKVKVYSLNDFTPFVDGSYSPVPTNGYYVAGNPIETYDIDFIPEVQAVNFFDGLIACLCDYPHNSGNVIFLDTEYHDVYLVLDNLAVPFEREGISFISNPTTNKDDMILSRRTTGVNEYYRYQFN